MLLNLLTEYGLLALTLFANGHESGADVIESPSFLIQTTDGGYAFRSCVYKAASEEYDAAIVWLDSQGNRIRSKQYGWGDDHEYFHTITRVSDGIVAAGYSDGGYSAFVVKVSNTGSLVWAREYGGSIMDWVNKIIPTSDGGFLAVGHTSSYGITGHGDALIMKISSTGAVQWAVNWGDESYDEAWDCVEVSDGYAVTGYFFDWNGTLTSDIFLMKITTSGTVSWIKTYNRSVSGTNRYEKGQAIVAVSDGFIVAGRDGNYDLGNDGDALLMKTDLSGNFSWAKTYSTSGTYDDIFYGLAIAPDGSLIAAGSANKAMLLAKIESDGTLSWARSFDYGWDEAYQALPVSGGYAMGGRLSAYHTVIVMDQDGNYAGCVASLSLTVTNRTLTATTRSTNIGYPSVPSSSVSPNVADFVPDSRQFCSPLYEDVEEGSGSPGPNITCSPIPGGFAAKSQSATTMSIYSADGKMIRSLDLKPGETRVDLEPGLYFWIAGKDKGKIPVR